MYFFISIHFLFTLFSLYRTSYECFVTSHTVAPLQDQIMETIDDLLDTGRKFIIYDPNRDHATGDGQGGRNQRYLNSATKLIGSDLKRRRLEATNLYKYVRIAVLPGRVLMEMNKSIALNSIAFTGTGVDDVLNNIHLSHLGIRCYAAKSRSAMKNEFYLQSSFHNSIPFDKRFIHFFISGIPGFHSRSLMSESARYSLAKLREKQKEGVSLNEALHKNIIKPVNLFSKILLPFALLILCLSIFSTSTFIIELLTGNGMD